MSLLRSANLALCLLALTAAHAAGVVARFRQDDTGAGRAAVRLARQALDRYCVTRERLPLPADLPPLLRERAGVFVSAQLAGAPRCCMGRLYPHGGNLAADLLEAACRAAAYDTRFPPLRAAELPRLRVIVSILAPAAPVADPWSLDPVADGLAVRGPRCTGVVLPGETGVRQRFVQWAQTRAQLRPGEAAEYLRLDAVRYIEPK